MFFKVNDKVKVIASKQRLRELGFSSHRIPKLFNTVGTISIIQLDNQCPIHIYNEVAGGYFTTSDLKLLERV